MFWRHGAIMAMSLDGGGVFSRDNSIVLGTQTSHPYTTYVGILAEGDMRVPTATSESGAQAWQVALAAVGLVAVAGVGYMLLEES
jgi:hypothetical protein